MNDPVREVMDRIEDRLMEKAKTSIGFPLNLTPLLPEVLNDCCRLLNKGVINNLGDPFAGGAYGLEMFDLERETVEWLADLHHLPKSRTWGYITSCGSEGNLRALSLGARKYPDGIIYHTDKAHYSIVNAAKMLGLETRVVKTDAKHNLDMWDFQFKLSRMKPAIVALTVGSTMGGGSDNIGQATCLLDGHDHYLHVDAALFGLLHPFLEGDRPGKGVFDWEVDSIAVSGHKMLGCPVPCGIFLLDTGKFGNQIGQRVDYINSFDATIHGSRSGFSVALLWRLIKELGSEGMKVNAERCMGTTEIAEHHLKDIGYPFWKNEHSNILVLKKPLEPVVRKWQLACELDAAHIILMPHVHSGMIREFCFDLKQPN